MRKIYSFLQIVCALILVFLFANTASAQIVVTNDVPYSTGFETGLGDWTTEAVNGTDTWSSIGGEHHTGSRSVNYSSSLFGDFLNIGQGDDDFLTIMMQLLSMMGQLENMGSESAYLISPLLDMSGVSGQASIRFYRKQTSMMVPQILYVMYRTSPSGSWTMLQQYNNTTDWTEETVNLPSLSSTYQVAFMGLFNAENMGDIDVMDFMNPDAMTNFASDIFLDDIYIGSASGTGPGSDCDAPQGLTTSYITTNSANVNWSGTANNWTVEYGPTGFSHGSGTTATAQNPLYTITGLTPNTTYDVYVRSNCTGSTSNWAQTTFTTAAGSAISENSSVLSVSPNPTNGIVRCSFNNLGNARIQVLDVYGKLLIEQNVTGADTEIDFSDKASGIYFLRVIEGNSVLTTQKVIRR